MQVWSKYRTQWKLVVDPTYVGTFSFYLRFTMEGGASFLGPQMTMTVTCGASSTTISASAQSYDKIQTHAIWPPNGSGTPIQYEFYDFQNTHPSCPIKYRGIASQSGGMSPVSAVQTSDLQKWKFDVLDPFSLQSITFSIRANSQLDLLGSNFISTGHILNLICGQSSTLVTGPNLSGFLSNTL